MFCIYMIRCKLNITRKEKYIILQLHFFVYNVKKIVDRNIFTPIAHEYYICNKRVYI